MARRIEHRSEFGYPADQVYAALTDENCLRERLSRIGGRQSELVSFTADGDETTVVMRQSIDAEYLPGVVRRITPDGVTIDRVETWRAPSEGDDGSYRGTVEASVRGFAGSLHGTRALSDSNASGAGDGSAGSVLVLYGEVKVQVPLVGGRIEAVIAEQLDRLMRAEARFTERWLESRQA
jgi:hypothetical protein